MRRKVKFTFVNNKLRRRTIEVLFSAIIALVVPRHGVTKNRLER